jgi:hypothetical protein
VLLGIGAVGLAVWVPALRSGAFVLAFVAVFLVGSAFTVAGRTARSLQRFRGVRVRVAVWGLPLSRTEASFYVESIASLGVGLLIRLQPAPGAKRTVLKIAQPSGVLLSGDRLTIGQAGYVQWSGRRLKRTAIAVGPALVLEPAAALP